VIKLWNVHCDIIYGFLPLDGWLKEEIFEEGIEFYFQILLVIELLPIGHFTSS
jgi:hypothetical protein